MRATCTKERLLDIVESFTAFEEGRGGLVKKLGKNHQYLGVNKALAKVREIDANKGRLGVFWHTQGSGKSLSMVFRNESDLAGVGGENPFYLRGFAVYEGGNLYLLV